MMFFSAASVSAQELKESNAHIGFIYPLSTNGVNAPDYLNRFSIHAIAGVSGAEQGFCASGMANYIKNNGNGFIAGGFANIIGADARGGQFAGFTNIIKGDVNGITASGFANITGGHTRGMQLGGFMNLSRKNTEGFQGAGFANISMGDVEGAQVSGFLNLADDVNGFQGSGFLNLADKADGMQAAGFGNNAKDINGAQIAGFYNLAGNVNSQVAGFINIAKKVEGVQVAGFINISDSCDYPIGIINISRKGEKYIGLTIDDNMTSLATFRSGGKYLYGIIGAGANFSYNIPIYSFESGIGAHIYVAKRLRINVEGAVTTLSDFWNTIQINSSARVLPALKISDRLELFAGPTYNYESSNFFLQPEHSRRSIWSRNQSGYYQRMYIGAIAGIHFNI